VALRRSRLGEWDPVFLRELATRPPEDALLAVLDAQGMSGTPTPVDAADWRELLAAGHQPMYRGINGERAEERAEQFRSGERPFVGFAASLGGRGSNFSTDPETAGGFARIVSLPNLFRPMEKQPRAEVVLIGYLRAGAVVLDSREALERRGSDVAAARRGGHDEVANLIEDLGVWAALRGIDAVFQQSGHLDRHYLVLNRGAMFVETAGSTAEERSWSGDRWIDCRCGEQHWGIYGAAGLLVVHRTPDGTVWLLMQHRSDTNQHSGTWGLFGGARSLRETALRAAMREAGEEAGLDPSTYTVRSTYVDDHGNWSYATVLAETDSLVTPGVPGNETVEAAWIRVDDLATLPLHPGFAATWPTVSAALLGQAHTLHTAEAHRDPGPDASPGR
jgi:8-oxo-dGTP pyrophosphatase MutT (NUDIX family)